MTEQTPTIPADQVRAARDLHRDAAKMVTITDVECEIHQHVADAMDALLPTPPRPTLADMTPEERAACKWMQCDVAQVGRAVIIYPNSGNEPATLIDRLGKVIYTGSNTVTPRPDLPRMEWPGTEKAAPAPALPDGWRLADHKENGRVVVTQPEPDADGEVIILCPQPGRITRTDTSWCDPDDLTYLDTDQ